MSPLLSRLIVILGALAATSPASSAGPRRHSHDPISASAGATGVARATASFVDNPLSEWPQISGINRIHFTDSQYNNEFAGNGFLLDHDGRTYAVSAKHVLLLARTAAMTAVDLTGTGVRWTIHPNQAQGEGVELGNLLNADPTEVLDPSVVTRDWLIFDVKTNRSPLRPLKLREHELPPGSTVYVVGCAYATAKDCRQDVLQGVVIESPQGSLLVDLPGTNMEALGGMSGAPVIDSDGKLVGIVSNLARHPTEARDVLAPAGLKYLQQVLAQLRPSGAAAEAM